MVSGRSEAAFTTWLVGRRTSELRKLAADEFVVQPETSRKSRERQVVGQICDQVVGLAVLQAITPDRRGEGEGDR
jgi:hypothetical protein